ncbi:cell division protein SepF [Berryella intestinalis]|uniref:cell division protein SepF n=1 Tax=Berryella intestinalis TaxID=1531429 RepID=UPI00130E54AA|nr:cell division protein SepF [Berryella intestinalis]
MAGFNASDGDGGFLGTIKSRLGFGDEPAAPARSRTRTRTARSERRTDDAEFAADEAVAEEFAEYGPGYRYSEDAYERSANAPTSEFPPLVSKKDMKRPASRLGHDPLKEAESVPSVSASGRMMVDNAAPAASSPRDRVERSSEARAAGGLNNLFSSTSSDAADRKPASERVPSSGEAPRAPKRGISVLRPSSYGDVERVAKIVRSGDVVVIALKNTPDDLSKRILDFSFGVSSALEAQVEYPGDKVYAICKGAALTFAELSALRKQGVL